MPNSHPELHLMDGNFAMHAYPQVANYHAGPHLPLHINAYNGPHSSYPGLLRGYNFFPYHHNRHMASAFDLRGAPIYHHGILNRGAFYSPYRATVQDDPCRMSKVASRESTSALKAWLSEHLKNPYPTKGEKILLAIVTKMSLTQVSTWFANARRRLKKENRVSWAAKSKSDEEEGESEDEAELLQGQYCPAADEEGDGDAEKEEGDRCEPVRQSAQRSSDERPIFTGDGQTADRETISDIPVLEGLKKGKDGNDNIKPKIWSLAEIATSRPVKRI